MSHAPVIRRLESHEAPGLASALTSIALRAKRSWGYPEAWIREWTPELTFDAQSLLADWTWVAYAEDRPVGFIILGGVDPNTGLFVDPQSPVSVEHLWIDPEDHGHGLGRALFEVLHRQAQASGAHELEVFSDPNAEGFYRHMGFQPYGEHQSTVCGLDRRLPILRMPLSTP